jgi:hypothetical protein
MNKKMPRFERRIGGFARGGWLASNPSLGRVEIMDPRLELFVVVTPFFDCKYGTALA